MSTPSMPSTESARLRQFTTTHWSVVFEAANPAAPGSMDAFARLYRDYWFPLYAYVRRRGRSPEQAEDLTQDFFVSLLERERLARLERDGGRFRSFLLKSLQNFLANDRARSSAQKRGGGLQWIAVDGPEAESRLVAERMVEPPELAFERHWAYTVLSHAMHALKMEFRSAGKDRLLEALWPHLQGDCLGRPHAEVAAELGMSESAVKVTVHRLRRRFRELLDAELTRTLDDPADVEGERRHLIAIISRAGDHPGDTRFTA